MQTIPVFYEFEDYTHHGENATLNYAVFSGDVDFILSVEPCKYEGHKIYKMQTTLCTSLCFPVHGWGSISLRHYKQNGCIDFYAKGFNNGEVISIGLISRARGEEAECNISLSLTSDWKIYSIPIKEICKTDTAFSIDDFCHVSINLPATQTMYIAGMRIVSPDPEPQYPLIKINQAGMKPDGKNMHGCPVSQIPMPYQVKRRFISSMKRMRYVLTVSCNA